MKRQITDSISENLTDSDLESIFMNLEISLNTKFLKYQLIFIFHLTLQGSLLLNFSYTLFLIFDSKIQIKTEH